MARVNVRRSPARLAAIVLCVLLGGACCESARAQTPQVAPAPNVPTGAPVPQPAWLGQVPMFQVGADGTVNVDQPVMMPAQPFAAGYPQQQMFYPQQQQQQQQMFYPQAAPAPATTPFAMPFTAQQPVVAQPWGQPAIQPQPAWGAPLGQTLLGASAIPPVFVHRHRVFGEFLYMRPRNAEVAYALPILGPVAPVLGNEVPRGPVAVVDHDYDPGFRIGFSLALDQGSSVGAQWTRLRFDAEDSVTVAPPLLLRSLVTHPLGANQATDTLDASARHDINLDTIDIDFRSLLFGCESGCAYAINYLIGVQYASLDQIFRSDFQVIGVTTVHTEVDFEGLGMRFGLQGERIWPQSGAFVYGSGITNLLFGEFNARYLQTNTFDPLQAQTSWTAGRIVPALEFEIGAGWLPLNRQLRLSAGYRVNTWFNMVTTDDWIHAVHTSNFRNMSSTLTFDGLVARAEWMF